ncbi:hypothetical protein F9C07_385 [Aspergillus flavus]|uniref:Uncharacterized protein n=1 Tax=Aspergillus flavus (strain ATCC 200026 / FGSC A1120 / IAM 13836 / NRRL 3357 / JCM 12722 / SRRC 167) TaxID=332952 RepID=A0A7U2QWM6_ASPFN|nr:hypothetical protein F9C07_385 [Aspergillus flavus]
MFQDNLPVEGDDTKIAVQCKKTIPDPDDLGRYDVIPNLEEYWVPGMLLITRGN